MCTRVSSVADAYHAAVAAGNKRHKTRTKDLVAATAALVTSQLPQQHAAGLASMPPAVEPTKATAATFCPPHVLIA